MKSIIISLLLLFVGHFSLQAQDAWLHWKYKDYDGIAFTAGRAVFDVASFFVKDEDGGQLLSRVSKVRVLVFQDRSPITDRDMRRFERKASRHHLEDIVMVRDGKTHVRVMAKDRRSALRKLVVFVRTPEESVLFSLKGNLRWNDLQSLIDQYGGDHIKNKDKKVIPPLVKVPVSRV